MASTNPNPPRNEVEDIQLPTEWPIIPVLIVDHSQNPSAEPYTTNAADLHSLADSNMSSNPSRIETDQRPTLSSNASASTKVSPSPLLIRPVSPSSPLQEDWSLRDRSFEMGPISPQWTALSDGALSPRWEKQQQKRSSSSGSILKEPKCTVYHIYQQKSRRHYIATTKLRPKKKWKWCWSKGGGGCGLFRRKARISEKEQAEAIEKGLMSATSNAGIELPEERWDTVDFPPEYTTGKQPEEEEEEEGYFWHQPFGLKKRKLKKVRTFRKGVTKKNSTILAEIPGVWFWKRWDIIWRESDENAGRLQHAAKSWSMPTEQGKLSINSENSKDKKKKKKNGKLPVDPSKLTQLKWASPLSKKTRQYTFTHGPLTFHWKGTSTVQSTRAFKAWCRYNHLKLVAEIPSPAPAARSSDAKAPASPPLPTHHTLVLASYVSDANPNKPGTLTLRDDAIASVWRAFIAPWEGTTGAGAGAAATPLDGQRGNVFAYGAGGGGGADDGDVKDSRFWDAIVATGLCMIFGEWQKRETIRQIIQALASGAGSA